MCRRSVLSKYLHLFQVSLHTCEEERRNREGKGKDRRQKYV